jgi:hypothetical protein
MHTSFRLQWNYLTKKLSKIDLFCVKSSLFFLFSTKMIPLFAQFLSYDRKKGDAFKQTLTQKSAESLLHFDHDSY